MHNLCLYFVLIYILSIFVSCLLTVVLCMCVCGMHFMCAFSPKKTYPTTCYSRWLPYVCRTRHPLRATWRPATRHWHHPLLLLRPVRPRLVPDWSRVRVIQVLQPRTIPPFPIITHRRHIRHRCSNKYKHYFFLINTQVKSNILWIIQLFWSVWTKFVFRLQQIFKMSNLFILTGELRAASNVTYGWTTYTHDINGKWQWTSRFTATCGQEYEAIAWKSVQWPAICHRQTV